MTVYIRVLGCGQKGIIHVRLDCEDGTELGQGEIATDSGIVKIPVPNVTGRHAVFFVFESGRTGWMKDSFEGRELCQMISFLFCK
jgi:hypothetical protein